MFNPESSVWHEKSDYVVLLLSLQRTPWVTFRTACLCLFA